MSNESKDSEQNKETYSENNYNKDPLNDVIDVDKNKNKTVIIKQTKESEKDLLSMNHLSIKKNTNNPTYQITINNINFAINLFYHEVFLLASWLMLKS